MREVFDLSKFLNILDEKCEEHGIEPARFHKTEEGEAVLDAIIAVPIENRYFGEKDIDWYIKINTALINKFKDQLVQEYGIEDLTDAVEMFNLLYKEQNEKTPNLWYEYTNGIKEEKGDTY